MDKLIKFLIAAFMIFALFCPMAQAADNDDEWPVPKDTPPSLRNKVVSLRRTIKFTVGDKTSMVQKSIHFPKDVSEEQFPNTLYEFIDLIRSNEDTVLTSRFWSRDFSLLEDDQDDLEGGEHPAEDAILATLAFIRSGKNPFIDSQSAKDLIKTFPVRLCMHKREAVICFNDAKKLTEADFTLAEKEFALKEAEVSARVKTYLMTCPHPDFLAKHVRDDSVISEEEAKAHLINIYKQGKARPRRLHNFFVGYSSYGISWDVESDTMYCFNEYPMAAFVCDTELDAPYMHDTIKCRKNGDLVLHLHNCDKDGHLELIRNFGTESTIKTLKPSFPQEHGPALYTYILNILISLHMELFNAINLGFFA